MKPKYRVTLEDFMGRPHVIVIKLKSKDPPHVIPTEVLTEFLRSINSKASWQDFMRMEDLFKSLGIESLLKMMKNDPRFTKIDVEVDEIMDGKLHKHLDMEVTVIKGVSKGAYKELIEDVGENLLPQNKLCKN